MLTRDLVAEVRTRMRPVDDPVLHMLVDPRRARALATDGLWVRLIDLPAALMARAYAAAVDVVIEVSDELLPANDGRWRLQAGGPSDGGKPSCERTTAEPDVALPVAALGRRLPRRHPARWARSRRTGHRAPPRRARRAVDRHVVGPRPLVPDDVLTRSTARQRPPLTAHLPRAATLPPAHQSEPRTGGLRRLAPYGVIQRSRREPTNRWLPCDRRAQCLVPGSTASPRADSRMIERSQATTRHGPAGSGRTAGGRCASWSPSEPSSAGSVLCSRRWS